VNCDSIHVQGGSAGLSSHGVIQAVCSWTVTCSASAAGMLQIHIGMHASVQVLMTTVQVQLEALMRLPMAEIGVDTHNVRTLHKPQR
jgi:hypothetical protein